MPRLSAVLAPALCALALWIDPAGAAQERRSIRVDASALDLSNESGIAALAQRIHRAVNRICGADHACRDAAWASTEAQVARAIDRDRWTRRLAEERRAELRRCGPAGCRLPAYAPPPTGAVVIVIYPPQPFIGAPIGR